MSSALVDANVWILSPSALVRQQMDAPKVQLTREQAMLLLSGGALGIAEWNEHFRIGHTPSDLNACQLRGADLRGVHLARVDLSGAQLAGADLFQADLSEAELSEADVCDAHLSEARLTGATLFQARAERANLVGADLSKAKLSYAELIQAQLVGANLCGANLNRAVLTAANLLGASLAGAKLGAADLRLANLSGADLEGADLSEANLQGANLCQAKLSRANLEAACLKGVKLERVELEGARLRACDLDLAVDLLLCDWESLRVDGVLFTRDAVESGAQVLPGGKPPLRMCFEVGGDVTPDDLNALRRLLRSSDKPRGTRVYLSLTETGSQLVIEGRGTLPSAARLGALLYALRGAAAEPEPAEADSDEARLRDSFHRAPPELVECAKKLNQVYVRPRAEAELEQFRALIRKYGADSDTTVSERVVTLVGRSPATERMLLDGLGIARSWASDEERAPASTPTSSSAASA